TQGILQGTYETFGACARKHFGGTLAGRLVLSAGLGGMGGAQPLAVTLNEGVGLFVEVHAGMVVVADGSADAARRLERVLTTDPGTGIMRHADAGYAEAIAAARRHRLDLPGITA